ncbi:MAG: NAD(P)H-binding protein [Solirubrobacterales bacterium]|nr:NAD(P)H-binding protein [Solirubrobacterales bacterium]
MAGASGVIGIRLLPLLVRAGHQVAGLTRSPEKVDALEALGVEPVLCDVYDAAALRAAVVEFRPVAVMHQVTDLPDDEAKIPQFAARQDRMVREGTGNSSTQRRLRMPRGFSLRASPGPCLASEASPIASTSTGCSTRAGS